MNRGDTTSRMFFRRLLTTLTSPVLRTNLFCENMSDLDGYLVNILPQYKD